jgi:hypothetical protein
MTGAPARYKMTAGPRWAPFLSIRLRDMRDVVAAALDGDDGPPGSSGGYLWAQWSVIVTSWRPFTVTARF